MTILFSLKFWLGVQLFIDLVLIGLFMVLFKRLKNQRGAKPLDDMKEISGEAGRTASQIIDMLEPLVKEADSAAISFDRQIRDKKNLIRGVNDSLDSRILSINLLLSRAESMLARATNLSNLPADSSSLSEHIRLPPGDDVFDQQKSIVDLYGQGLDADAIASRLSMSKGEVQLVISLKKKFTAMETLL